MKGVRIVAVIVLVFMVGNTYAQDILTFKSGKRVEVEIVEDSYEVIKYKKYKEEKGPTFLVDKSKILKIEYQSKEKDNPTEKESIDVKEGMGRSETLKIEHKIFGMKYFEDSKEITKNKLVHILKSNPRAYRQYNIGKNLTIIGNVIGIPAGIVLGYNIVKWARKNEKQNQKKNKRVLTISGLSWGGAAILTYAGKEIKKRAGKSYNNSREIGYRLNISENGVGIALHF